MHIFGCTLKTNSIYFIKLLVRTFLRSFPGSQMAYKIYLEEIFPHVYWTVHHLDSWIKIDQLHVTCFIISLLTAEHVSNV